MPNYRLGDHIDIYCRYCRLNLNGAVAGVVKGKVVKVQCKTCLNIQDYRPPLSPKEMRAKAVKRALSMRDRRVGGHQGLIQENSAPNLSQEAVARSMWEEATRDANPLKSILYDETKGFSLKDIVTHPDYGLGVVMEVWHREIVVLFREGLKRLPHNRRREDEQP